MEVRRPVEDLDGDDDGHRPGEHERRGEEHANDRADLHEQEREQRPDHDRERHARGGEHDRAEQRVPEDGVAEDRRVVVEPDPGALALDQLGQPVALERERDELVEGIAEDRRHHDDDRGDQQIGDGRRRRPRRQENGRRRRDRGDMASAATAELSGTRLLNEFRVPAYARYDWLRVNAMLSLATSAACLIVILFVRIRESMVRRIFPFSTLTQCFAVGTNQLLASGPLVHARTEESSSCSGCSPSHAARSWTCCR